MEDEEAEVVVLFPPRAEEEEAGAALEASSFNESGLGAAGWEEKGLLAVVREGTEGGGAAGILGRYRPRRREG